MRPQIVGSVQPATVQVVGQHPLNGDLAESALLPSSSTSPQNAAGSLYLTQQQQPTVVKAEPTNYETMGGGDGYVSLILVGFTRV